MSSLTPSQVVAVLSLYDSQYRQNAKTVADLQALSRTQSDQLTTLIASGASQSAVTAQINLINSTQQSIIDANNFLKTINIAKTNAENALCVLNGVTGATGPTINPFAGVTGARGPVGPTGPAWSATVDTSATSGSSNPLSSQGAYDAIQSASSSSQSSGLSMSVGTSTSISSDIQLLCRFEGTDGSSNIIDSSNYQRTFGLQNLNGTYPTLTTSYKKFGSSSLNLLNGAFLSVNGPLALGTRPFTLEFWVYLPTQNAINTLVSLGNFDGFFGLTSSGFSSTFLQNGNMFFSGGAYATNTWHHIALCRSSTTNYVFINGVLRSSDSSTIANIGNQVLYIGKGDPTRGYCNGYIDELKLTFDQCVYTSNFTPPSEAFASPTPSLPTTNNSEGQMWTDGTSLYMCTTAGSPGTWKQLSLSTTS